MNVAQSRLVLECLSTSISSSLAASPASRFRFESAAGVHQASAESLVSFWPGMVLWMFTDPEWGLQQYAPTEFCIQQLVSLHRSVLHGEAVSRGAWEEVSGQCSALHQSVSVAWIPENDPPIAHAAFAGYAAASTMARLAKLEENPKERHGLSVGAVAWNHCLGFGKEAVVHQAQTFLELLRVPVRQQCA